jgi:serine protease Do
MKQNLTHNLMAAALLSLATQADTQAKPPPLPKARIIVQAKAVKQGTYLGVGLAPIPAIARDQLDIPEGVGIAIGHVAKGSPAEKAKLRVNDIITKLDDQLIINAEQFQTLIKVKKPGDEIALTLYRKGKEQKVKAKLATGNVSIQLGQRNVPFRWQGDQWIPQLNDGFEAFPFVEPNNPKAMEHIRKAIEAWQKQWKNIEPGKLPDGAPGFFFQLPGQRFQEIPIPPRQLKGIPNVPGMKHLRIANASATIKDNTGTYTLSTANGRKKFKAVDNDGTALFEGPVNTDKERKEVPKEVRGKLEQLEKVRKNRKRFEFKFDLNLKDFDGDGDLDFRILPRELKPKEKKGDIL